MNAINWLRSNWEGVLAVVGALLTVCSSLKQLLERYPRAERVLNVVIDLLSLVPRKGQRGVFGRVNLPGVPSLPAKVERDDDDDQRPSGGIPLMRAAIFVGFILPAALVLSGCGTTRAQWRSAGIDAGKCVAPAVMDAASDAIVAYLDTVAASTNLDYVNLGKTIASKYGVDAAICAIGKIWANLGGPGTKIMGQPTRVYTATAYLVNHTDEWAFPAK